MALLTAPLCFAPPLEVFLLPDVPVFLLLPEEADVLLGDAEEEPERVPVPDLPAELPEELFRDGLLLVFFCAMYILHAAFKQRFRDQNHHFRRSQYQNARGLQECPSRLSDQIPCVYADAAWALEGDS